MARGKQKDAQLKKALRHNSALINKYWYADDKIEALEEQVASLRTQVEKLREALKQIKIGSENQGPFHGMSFLDVRQICKQALEETGDGE